MSYRYTDNDTTKQQSGCRRNLKFVLGVVLGIPLGLVLLCVTCTVCGRLGFATLGAVTDQIGVGGPLAAVKVGEPVPDVTLERLDGTAVAVSDYRGTPVLLNFWATWCAPCVAEVPALNATATKYGDHELVVLAVNASDSRAKMEQFVSEHDVDFTFLLDLENETRWTYRVFSVPTAILIDADGVVLATHTGAMTEGQIEEMLALVPLTTGFPRYVAPGR